MERVKINDLNAKEYEDPRDSVCLSVLKLNKSFDKLFKLAMEYGIERADILSYTGSYVKVSEKSMPYVYSCVKEGCEILGMDLPRIYITQDPYINAYTTGTGNPILVINTGTIDLLSHDEFMFVIGHELGHIKSEHCQYKMIGGALESVGDRVLSSFKFGSYVSMGIYYAYMEWVRCAEFTADHAGLLVCQNLEAAITACAKMGGYPERYYDTLDANEFLTQAQEFKGLDEDIYNKFMKIYINLNRSHPWTVFRARELMLWVQSGEFVRILKRGSSWTRKELERLAGLTDKAFAKRAEKYEKLRALQIEREVEFIENEIESVTVKGPKAILQKGQDGIKNVQAKISENNYKQKLKESIEAQEAMERVGLNEKQLRAIYKEIPDTEVQELTDMYIGGLLRIEEKVDDEPEE